jgi:hypothetical protein
MQKKTTTKPNGQSENKTISSKQKGKSKELEESPGRNYLPIIAGIAFIIIVLLLTYLYFSSAQSSITVPFSVFESNLNSAQKLFITVTFHNASQYTDLSICSTSITQVLAQKRKSSTIGVFFINLGNSTCQYDNSLGYPITLNTSNSTYCQSLAKTEPGIFLNYSSQNSTIITSKHIYIYGNASYMHTCAIAADFS